MIILISGTSCTGKTLLAQKLLEKYKMPYLSIDHLKMGLYRGVSNVGFTPLDRSDVIGEKLWPILKEIIMTNIENDQNLIMEGCYLLPQYIHDFEKSYADQIISVFLGFSTKYITEHFETSIIGHRNAIESRKYSEDRTIDEVIIEHNEMRRSCLEHRVDYFEIDEDYHVEIMKVYEFIEAKRQFCERHT